MSPENRSEDNLANKDSLNVRQNIEQKLAEISMEHYSDLPRKTKKAVQKRKTNQYLTSQERARLQSIRPKPEHGYKED
jgi:hypothetical protein